MKCKQNVDRISAIPFLYGFLMKFGTVCIFIPGVY